jgi:hypothetical protein
MSAHAAFRRQPVDQQVAQHLRTITIPAPTRGIIQNENEAYMQPGGALVQVFFRYVLNNSLSWPDELSRFAITWTVFLGSAMVTRRSRQIAIDMLMRSLSPRGLVIHTFLVRVIMAAVAAFLLHYGSELVSKATHISPALQWPVAYLYLAVPVGARELVDDVAVPIELQPFQAIQDRSDGRLGRALAIGILDP